MRPTKETGILTVADVREPRGKGGSRPLQRAAADLRASAFEGRACRRLREALDRGQPVKAMLNPRRGTRRAA